MDVMGNKIEGNVVSFKSHGKFDACGQRITDLVLLEGKLVVSVSFMAILTPSGRRWVSKEGRRKSLVRERPIIQASLLSCDMLLCRSSLYFNRGSYFFI